PHRLHPGCAGRRAPSPPSALPPPAALGRRSLFSFEAPSPVSLLAEITASLERGSSATPHRRRLRTRGYGAGGFRERDSECKRASRSAGRCTPSSTRLLVADHEGRAKAVEEVVDVPIGNLRGM